MLELNEMREWLILNLMGVGFSGKNFVIKSEFMHK